jgi:hypothetical protein
VTSHRKPLTDRLGIRDRLEALDSTPAAMVDFAAAVRVANRLWPWPTPPPNPASGATQTPAQAPQGPVQPPQPAAEGPEGSGTSNAVPGAPDASEGRSGPSAGHSGSVSNQTQGEREPRVGAFGAYRVPVEECADCGELVPERQEPPYPGHREGCGLIAEWETEDELIEGRIKSHQRAQGCPCYDDPDLAPFDVRDDCPVHGSPLDCAAGPWIRVESGELPKHDECILVWFGGFGFPACGTYDATDGTVSHKEGRCPFASFTWWARIRPPEGR